MGLGCPQGHQLAPLAAEQPAQLEQVIGIGSPTVQKHQAFAGSFGPALQGFADGLISLPGLHRIRRACASTGPMLLGSRAQPAGSLVRWARGLAA